jgi:hypothetical protein
VLFSRLPGAGLVWSQAFATITKLYEACTLIENQPPSRALAQSVGKNENDGLDPR